MVFGNLFKDAKAKREAAAKAPPRRQEKKTNQRPQKKKRPRSDQKETAGSPQKRQRGDRKPSRRHNSNHKPFKRPSQEALDLSKRLQELSRQKKLREAIDVYWARENNSIRDGHHACIVIDCCARCGDIDAADRIVSKLDSVNVETQTALMKGYAHSGRMHQAMALFREMVEVEDDSRRPNVRTLNTLLRGCLWTAATTDGSSSETIVGGVVTSESAWKMYVDKFGTASLDTSSYEYSITLLCQALRIKDAEARIQAFQTAHNIKVKGKASISGGDQSSLEGMAVAYVGLARAHALRGEFEEMWKACQRVLSAVRSSRALLSEESTPVDAEGGGKKNKKQWQQKAAGGKRAWKNRNGKEGTEDERLSDQRRASSNQAFRTHRLNEVENEAKIFLRIRKEGTASTMRKTVALRLLCRLFYFSGGGTTEMKAIHKQDRTLSDSTLNLAPSWLSFGLAELVDEDLQKVNLSELDTKCIFESFDLLPRTPLRTNGLMNFGGIFQDEERPVDIELGAGFGDWITCQARTYKNRNHIAVELRADRVAQIFARGSLDANRSPDSLNNLCVVGAECGSFLRDRIPDQSVSTIFANHPEPPTQTFGDDRNDLDAIMKGGDEPAHMLNSEAMISMAKCLKEDGRVVIVTDNRWYARLISVTACRAITELTKRAKRKNDLHLCSEKAQRLTKLGYKHIETFGARTNASVELFEGKPNKTIGHAKTEGEGGTSYFDRLWRSGAGSHAEQRARFVVVLIRPN